MKTILLVGASSAVAKTLATQVLKNGDRVIALSRTNPEIPGIEYAFFDSMREDDLPEIDGKIDALVYFPGSILLKPFRGLKQQDFLNDFQINVLGAIRVIQGYTANLQLAESPSIVLFSSVAAQTGMSFHASVAVSKSALEGLTRALAAEFAPKIRVNCIAPSLTDTPLAERLVSTEDKKAASAQRHPLKRIGAPEDLAQAVAFLISDNSTWITGQVLAVDGGLSTLRV